MYQPFPGKLPSTERSGRRDALAHATERLVYKSVPEASTRLAMLKQGEMDLA